MEHELDCPGFSDKRGEEEGFCKAFCYSCCKCEPLREGDYKICGECFHVYRTMEECTSEYACIKCAHDF